MSKNKINKSFSKIQKKKSNFFTKNATKDSLCIPTRSLESLLEVIVWAINYPKMLLSRRQRVRWKILDSKWKTFRTLRVTISSTIWILTTLISMLLQNWLRSHRLFLMRKKKEWRKKKAFLMLLVCKKLPNSNLQEP